MAKQRDDVDWYVDMSERLERREHRRKWVILGFFVAVPLLVMGGLMLYVLVLKPLVSRWRGSTQTEDGTSHEKPVTRKEQPVGPVAVAAFQKGDMRFPQLDNEGLMTSMNHFFKEERPKNAEAFTVSRESDEEGTIANYRLRNIGTGMVYEFSAVRVRRLNMEWTIMDEGWTKIREDLQAKMKVKLGRPQL